MYHRMTENELVIAALARAKAAKAALNRFEGEARFLSELFKFLSQSLAACAVNTPGLQERLEAYPSAEQIKQLLVDLKGAQTEYYDSNRELTKYGVRLD